MTTKTLNKAIMRTAYTLNYLYSIVWIAVTGTDKWAYRDTSMVHAALIDIGFRASRRVHEIEVSEAVAYIKEVA